MPRYHLNVRRDGVLIPDPEGDELPNVAAARKLAGEIVQDMVRLPHVYGERREWQKNEFLITNETGATMLVLPFWESEAEG